MTDSVILAHSLTSKERTKDVILTENISFSSFILPPEILKGLSASGFEKPSPIQVKALPVGRCGFDLIVKSKSGTGKTLVFGIISLESVKLEKCDPQVLILAPTREIAVQIQEVIKNIGKFYEGLSVKCFIGGLPLNTDKINCQSCHIAVGTPGRVKQLIQDGSLRIKFVKIFVLDEADKLMEESFQNDINEIYNSLPDRKQIIMSSATYPDECFLSQYMHSPVLVTVELETPLLLGLRQYVRLLKFSPNVVQQTKVKNDELLKILSTVPFIQCLIFSNYQSRAESISNFLNRSSWSSIFMSAAQSQTQRLSSLSDLKDFKSKILVTTDLTARGVDAPNVDLVINYDMPINATTYLHRMGRAGRYGASGNCINLTFIGQEAKLLQNILGVIGGQTLSIPILDDTFNLDIDKIPKENYLFGEAVDSVTDFNTYSNEISEIRSSVAENSSKKGVKGNNKKKSKPNSAKDGDILNNVIEQNLNGDVSLVLAELASGSFILSTNSTTPDIDSFSTLLKSDSISAIHKSDPIKCGENRFNSKKRSEPSLLLQKLASEGEILDKIVSKSESVDKQRFQDETLCKNKALFSVAKLLSDVEVSNEDCTDLSAYFSTLKSQEKLEFENEKRKRDHGHGDANILENIFSLAYKSQVSKEAEKWQDLLDDKDKNKLLDSFEMKTEDTDQYDDSADVPEEFYDEDYDFEVDKEIEMNYADNMNDYSFMEWIPVEPKNSQNEPIEAQNTQDVALKGSVLAKKKKKTEGACCYPYNSTPPEITSYHEQYSQYFQHCSSSLWHNGLAFDSVQRFDGWFFNDWERQLEAVRNFVQKKIYLEEMTNYS